MLSYNEIKSTHGRTMGRAHEKNNLCKVGTLDSHRHPWYGIVLHRPWIGARDAAM